MTKKIVLFADGTGNAFSKQESNIWRLFDVLDTSQNDQIAYYIEGVGTSSFRPWAIFDGATGVGAPATTQALSFPVLELARARRDLYVRLQPWRFHDPNLN
jgi:Uncharacterized alpha/beta hydrolase domain (DUF2235)